MNRMPLLLAASLLMLLAVVPLTLIAQDAPPADAPEPTSEPLPTRGARPNPTFNFTQEGAMLQLYFATLPQGHTGLARISSPNNERMISAVRARFLNELIDFFPADDGYYGLLAAGMESDTNANTPLDVFVTFGDGTRTTINTTVQVGLGGFIRQNINVAAERAYLLDIETERSEIARLQGLFSMVTLEKMWDERGFQMPILAGLTAPFGAFRTFNGAINTRHTGWDIRTTTGAPVQASAAGTVAYVGLLPIRGLHIVIDHGFGVYSGYSHLSEATVERDQRVERGQVVGMVGDTGRTSGAHFHWEASVNGYFVDSVQLLRLWTP